MAFDEPRFTHVGLSSDGAMVFCAMDSGKAYAMPLSVLERAEDWDAAARPKAAAIIHDGYAAIVEFNSGLQIDFPADFVLQVCEPSYGYGEDRTASGVGGRIRVVRQARGLSLDALAAKCGIAKPNLSRLENDKVTPTFETLRTIAAALDTHPALLVAAKKPEHAWTWTRHTFIEWKHGLLAKASGRDSSVKVRPAEMVKVFLATRPEHGYARAKLVRYAADDRELGTIGLDAGKWQSEAAATNAAREHAKRGKAVAKIR